MLIIQTSLEEYAPQIPDELFYLILIGVGLFLFFRWSAKSKEDKIDDIKNAPKEISSGLSFWFIIALITAATIGIFWFGVKGMNALFGW